MQKKNKKWQGVDCSKLKKANNTAHYATNYTYYISTLSDDAGLWSDVEPPSSCLEMKGEA